MTFLALSLALAAQAMPAPKIAPNNAAGAVELKAALEAHMDGDDVKARRRLGACIKTAAIDSPDLSGCQIYLEWWAEGAKQIDKPSRPEARRLYSLGADAYKAGNLKLADQAWHLCLDYSEVGTAVRNDCMAMIDLVPKTRVPDDEVKSRETYLEGFIAFGEGDFAKARAKWAACLTSAPAGSSTASDCKAGLAKINADKKP